MRPSFLALSALCFSASLTLADSDTNLNDVRTLQTPTFTADELGKIPFTTKLFPGYDNAELLIQVHNPFRNKTFRGVVVHVQSKPADGKEESLDIFADLDCGPLQTSSIRVPLFNAEEIAKRSPVITLKEVHREAQAEPEQDKLDALKLPSFTPEEVKQMPFSWWFPTNQSSPGLEFDLHNPFRDKTISGILFQVKYKAADGQEQSVEIFSDFRCSALAHAYGSISVFNANVVSKASPVVTLKEVHRESPPGK